MKRPRTPQFSPNGWVHQVKPKDQLNLELPQPLVLTGWVGVVGRLLLPIISLLFTATFWTVGVIVSYWPTTKQTDNITDCLTINLA